MENEKISVKTCGKLYIAGEYSVLKCGNSAIIKNVDIFINKKHFYRFFFDFFFLPLTAKKCFLSMVRKVSEIDDNNTYLFNIDKRFYDGIF